MANNNNSQFPPGIHYGIHHLLRGQYHVARCRRHCRPLMAWPSQLPLQISRGGRLHSGVYRGSGYHRESSTFQCCGAEYRRWQLPILNAFALNVWYVGITGMKSLQLALYQDFNSQYFPSIFSWATRAIGECNSSGQEFLRCIISPSIYLI